MRPQTIARDLKIAPSEKQYKTSHSDPCLPSTQHQFDFKIIVCIESNGMLGTSFIQLCDQYVACYGAL